MLLATSREVQKSVGEQVRGMKVRSAVKKLCEGCKVRLVVISFAVFLGRSEEWQGERMGRIG